MGNRLITFILGILLLPAWQCASAQPQVAASIRPLLLIADAITDGISRPDLVLDATQDPHHPALRPSQRRVIDQAGVFLWIGPAMETGLEKVATERPDSVLTAMELPMLNRQAIGDTPDPHVWLDTGNALMIAASLADRLAALDPENAGHYRDNLRLFREDVHSLDAAIRERLQSDTFPPFAVYHNGYQYFEAQFGLQHVTSFTGNEEVQPGIRQLLAIRTELANNQVHCIVTGPSQNTARLDNQLEQDAMRYVTIDVLGYDIERSKDGYSRFMRQLAEAFAGCRTE